MNKIFSFDIGIASVGWAVVDTDYNIIEAGANMFNSADASNNVERREARQHKRLLRRKRNRIQDFKKLWRSYNFIVPNENNNNQLVLRNKGIKSELTFDEIYFVLSNMLVHRGISYLDDAIDESKGGQSDYQKGLFYNQEELKTKYPCQIQLERLEQYGKYRGYVETEDKDITYSNVFTKNSYKKELEKFFYTQRKYHNSIDMEFVDKYMKIFDRKREYYEGPGNELSRTDYGIYTTKLDNLTGKYITEDNLFEKLIGKCSVYPEEMRAAGASYTAQEFNILNDLNNLTVNNRKLTKDEKKEIISIVKTSNSINMRKIIRKVINEDIESFVGARIDKNDKEIFHSFEQYNKMRKELEKIGESIERFEVCVNTHKEWQKVNNSEQRRIIPNSQ